jgi:beta-barrel assembly-enhancing protease
MNARRACFYSFLSIVLVLSILGDRVKTGQAMTSEEEKKLGKQVLEDIARHEELVRDLSLQDFVNRVGRSLLGHIGPTPFEYDFYVIRSREPNAFAIPGGHIFITTGLLGLSESEAEVAGVLSHEISHVKGRHIDQMIERSKRFNIAALAAMIAGAIAGRGGATSQAAAAAALAGAESMMLKYTRENEVDADQNGMNLMIKAGYNPYALVSFLKKMERHSLGAPKVPQYLMTHPALDSRIALVDTLLTLEPKPAVPFQELGSYKRIQLRGLVEERGGLDAVSHFESLVKASPEDTDALFGLGLAYQRAGRPDKSIETFQRASQLDPADRELTRELGVGLFISGKLDQAIEVLAPLSENGDLKSLYFLGRAYQEKGNIDRARVLFLKVKERSGEYLDLYYNLGSVYGRAGQKGLSHYYFARYFELKGDRKNALLHYSTALDYLEPGSVEREEARKMVREMNPPPKK